MKLKITSGIFKGRPLQSPKGEQTRPTSEKVRQSFFNSYQNIIPDCTFLDLFAGSGAMGFEALSHGATKVVFVEKHKFALDAIHQNIKTLNISDQTQVIGCDALTGLERLVKQGAVFDVIYIDPPYHFTQIKKTILDALDSSPLIKKGSFIFVEENTKTPSNIDKETYQRLIYNKTKKIGETLIHELSV